MGREGRGKGGKGRRGERGRNVEGPGKWSAPGPALALGGPGITRPRTVTHPGTNRVRRRVTALMKY